MADDVDSTDQELQALRSESEALQHQIADLYSRYQSGQLVVGPLRFRAHLSAQRLFQLYTGLHVAAGFAGAGLILRGGQRSTTLGIALVVGALFALGAFLAQVWALAVDKDRWVAEIHDEPFRAKLREALERCGQVDALLEEAGERPADNVLGLRLKRTR